VIEPRGGPIESASLRHQIHMARSRAVSRAYHIVRAGRPSAGQNASFSRGGGLKYTHHSIVGAGTRLP